MKARLFTACGALGLALTLVGAAAAQSLPPAHGPVPPTSPYAGPDRAPQGQSRPTSEPAHPGDSLSQGVIQPPATGDGGVIAPPNTDKTPMPVIPPPGTPGGNERVQPK